MEPQTAYLEMRGATGGDEAKLWGADLLRMYIRFAQKKGWKLVQVAENTIKIEGPGVFDILKNAYSSVYPEITSRNSTS